MPIRLLQDLALDPSEIDALIEAFHAVCRELRLTEKDDPACRFVAEKILTFVEAGERDPHRIALLALAELRAEPRDNKTAAQ
jgi:hypothetical protein